MDLKAKLSNARQKLLRRSSHQSTAASARSTASAGSGSIGRAPRTNSSIRKSASLTKLPAVSSESVRADEADQRLTQSAILPSPPAPPPPPAGDASSSEGIAHGADPSLTSSSADHRRSRDRTSTPAAAQPPAPSPDAVPTACPAVTLEEPTPVSPPVHPHALTQQAPPLPSADAAAASEHPSELRTIPPRSSKNPPPDILRRQSLVTNSNARAIRSLLEPEPHHAIAAAAPAPADYFGSAAAPTFNANMLHRKIWVKRANASATLVQIREDDLVDDVRDMILKKYANSLGKSFDSPDVALRIHPRDTTSKAGDRILGPEEDMCRTLDAYYPGGQTVHEALLIEVPQRRTPKPSPRIPMYYSHHDDSRPYEGSSEYFPPMPIVNPSPAALAAASHDGLTLQRAPHSIAVLQTGQLPPLPSPGSTRRSHHGGRPKYPRHNTASPTTLTNSAAISVSAPRPSQRPRHDSSASETKHSATSNPQISTPPATETAPRQGSTPPTPRVASPRPKEKRKKQRAVEPPSLPAGLLDNSVPPINVLIVEDNIINLRVLGAFMQRLKVRWQRAMNGKEAVTKWRSGGFHLVLMDIQLPIMNGLDATKEIRRLERVNSIGVFSSGSSEAPNNRLGTEGNYGSEVNEEDKLADKSLFKSPVIIVALTASSLQSDRHEALAAGCNDFLTKPVNFVWLERKVKEWGCMQALIDFDGWRKWKDFAAQSDADGAGRTSTNYSTVAPRSKSNALTPISAANATNGKTGPTAANGVISVPKVKDEEKKSKRRSFGLVPPPPMPQLAESSSPPLDEHDT